VTSHSIADLEQVVGQALDMTLRDLLRENYTPDVRAAWCTVYACISSIMTEGLLAESGESEAAWGGASEAPGPGGHASAEASGVKMLHGLWALPESESTCNSDSEGDRTDAETAELDREQSMPTTPEASTEDEREARPKELQCMLVKE